MPSEIRALLNKIKWDPELKDKNFLISYIHRGIPGNQKTIESKKIDNISKNFMTFVEKDIITYIPYHRILEVKEKGTNEIIYSKK